MRGRRRANTARPRHPRGALSAPHHESEARSCRPTLLHVSRAMYFRWPQAGGKARGPRRSCPKRTGSPPRSARRSSPMPASTMNSGTRGSRYLHSPRPGSNAQLKPRPCSSRHWSASSRPRGGILGGVRSARRAGRPISKVTAVRRCVHRSAFDDRRVGVPDAVG